MSAPPIPPIPPPESAPFHYVTRIMPSSSPELTKFLAKYPVGAKLPRDTSSDWTVQEVQTTSDLPPDPTGPVTQVTLILTVVPPIVVPA